MRLLTWNMGHIAGHWNDILRDKELDVALLQEAVPPPAGTALETVPPADQSWTTAGGNRGFCAAIARLSDRVTLRPIPTKPLAEASASYLGVSLPGTLAACEVTVQGEKITLVSVYGAWSGSISDKPTWIYADAAAHRLISDVSALVASQRGHKIIVAGDLNILYGYGDNGSPYWRARYETVFTRMEAIGLPFIGPQHPNGDMASPHPGELPEDSKNVPTFRTKKNDPATATRQLDFVFASRDIANRLRVRACNRAEEWGPSDHCRVEIELTSQHQE